MMFMMKQKFVVDSNSKAYENNDSNIKVLAEWLPFFILKITSSNELKEFDIFNIIK